MNCIACNYDNSMIIKQTFTLVLPTYAQSLNQTGTNGKNAHAYRKARNRWARMLQPYNHLPKATEYRRIFITRFWGTGKRAYDYGNLVGGFKPLLDMVVKTGLLYDDSPRWVSEYYQQYKSPDGNEHVIVVIEEPE